MIGTNFQALRKRSYQSKTNRKRSYEFSIFCKFGDVWNGNKDFKNVSERTKSSIYTFTIHFYYSL